MNHLVSKFIKQVIVFAFLISITHLKAQGVDDVISAGQNDASTYLGTYLKPVFKSLIYNVNSGWYTTGSVHKKYGFDITINASASFIPDFDKTFNFKNSDYTVLSLSGGATSANLPTIMGQESTQAIDVRIPIDVFGNPVPLGNHVGFKIADFETLNGIEQDLKDATGYAAVPSPMIQVGLGLPSRTDLKLRVVPKMGNDDIKFNMFGLGLQHDLLQHFRTDKDEKNKFDLSVLAAYTFLKTVYAPQNTTTAINQETIIKIDGYTAQLIGNFKLKFIDFYGGFGYTGGNTSVNIKGDYTYTYTVVGVPLLDITERISDPISISHSLSKVKANLGMRFNIKIFKIFADYSFQEYNTANVGITLSIN